MFGLAWTEIGLIAVVAMVLIGPKDMPVAIRAVADMVKKARRMAGEFQTHVDEMMRDADMQGVRESISEIRNFDIRGEVTRTIDRDGSIRAAFTDDPLRPASSGATHPMTPAAAPALVQSPEPAEGHVSIAPPSVAAPAFVPPAFVPPSLESSGAGAEAAGATSPPPAFIPPEAARPLA